ncbi:MAG: NUDIX domain-containing protein [Alteromonadaceae bacterium]|nr:NUDIX domain-containing protein [Alteromonadaceae bacterium]
MIKYYWFVPGGRVYKNENLSDAYARICQNELGIRLDYEKREFQGVYEHFYNNAMYDDNASTHYVVLAHRLALNKEGLILPTDQHHDYHWFNIEDLLKETKVNGFTKDYFIDFLDKD